MANFEAKKQHTQQSCDKAHRDKVILNRSAKSCNRMHRKCDKCPAYNTRYRKCNKMGHFQVACKTKTLKEVSTQSVLDSDEVSFSIGRIFHEFTTESKPTVIWWLGSEATGKRVPCRLENRYRCRHYSYHKGDIQWIMPQTWIDSHKGTSQEEKSSALENSFPLLNTKDTNTSIGLP